MSVQVPILLSGSSGMLGGAVASALQAQESVLRRLVRHPATTADELRWDPAGQGIEESQRLEGLGAVIHLSGANVADRRWTPAYKREIWESRVRSTRILCETLARLKDPPKVLLAASATGFYGNRGDEVLDEDSNPGTGFFPELCTAWEAATQPVHEAGIRVVHLRTGVVLSRDSGAVQKLLPVFRMGLGGKLGSGQQWMNWIALEDHVAAVLFLLASESISGPVNLVAPNPVTNAEFTHELARALHRPAFLPVPAFGLRLLFGEMADEALLASERVVPRRLRQAGFPFRYPALHEALQAIFAQQSRPMNSGR